MYTIYAFIITKLNFNILYILCLRWYHYTVISQLCQIIFALCWCANQNQCCAPKEQDLRKKKIRNVLHFKLRLCERSL